MMPDSFPALILTQNDNRETHAELTTQTPDDLPEGDVLVKVSYSSLNYKDALAVTGAGRIIRQFPMVPGIDFVGQVVESSSSTYREGDKVILTGWGVGEKHPGGFAGYARVQSDWLVRLPSNLSEQDAMTIGTAGFTAMLAVNALENAGLTPDAGEVVVTGASGGAGSMAVAILATLGYSVVASTGRESLTDYLTELGAARVIGRFEKPERPMASSTWAGAIDSVGGDTLAAVITQMHYGASIAAYGMAGGGDLNITVFPFILRGVNLLGVDSVMCPPEPRQQAWMRAASTLSKDQLAAMRTTITLANVSATSANMLNGDVRGRTVIDIQASAS